MNKNAQRSGGDGKRSKLSLLDLLNGLCSGLTKSTTENFRHLAAGSILDRGRGWISGAIRLAVYFGCRKQHAALYRFFSRARWCPDVMGRRILDAVLEWTDDVIELVVDDTLCKRTGPHVWGAGVHVDPLATIYRNDVRSAGKKAFAFGHSWVVLAVRVRPKWFTGPGFAIPILSRLYRAKKMCPDEEYEKRTELAAAMVAKIRSWLPESRKVHVVADHEYACKSVIGALPERFGFTGPLPKKARFYALPPKRRPGQRGRPRKRGEALPSPAELASCRRATWRKIKAAIYSKTVRLEVFEQRGLWYRVDQKRLCRMIIVRDPSGRYQTRALVTTDLKSSVTSIVERFSRRWLIEVMFRQAKQHLGLGGAQNGWERGTGSRMERRRARERSKGHGHKGRRAVERTVPFVFVTQAAVITHGLRNWTERGAVVRAWAPPWARWRGRPSFGNLLTYCRAELAQEALSADPGEMRVGAKHPPTLPISLVAA